MKYKIVIILTLFAAVSCIKDTGNYDYRDINGLVIDPRTGIKGISGRYNVPLGERLMITPELEFTIGEEYGEQRFEWHVLDGSNRSRGVISRERNLDYIVGAPYTSRQATYQMLYCVYVKAGDKEVRYDQQFTLIVQDKMMVGFIMICETEDNFDIELISLYQDTLTQYHNVLDFFQSELPREGITPWDVVCYPDAYSPMVNRPSDDKGFAIWILTDKGTERLRVEDYEWREEYDIRGISMILDKYLGADQKFIATKMNPQIYSANYSNWICDTEGNWFWYNITGRANFPVHPVNRHQTSDAPYKAAPFMFGRPDHAAILFNEDENQFEIQNADATTGYEIMYSKPLVGTETFDWQNPNYRLIYMGNRTREGQGFAIVKNVSNDRYEFLSWNNTSKLSINKQLRKDFPFDNSKRLEDFLAFVYQPDMTWLYWATEDEIWRIDVNAMDGWVNITNEVKPEGHKITVFKTTACLHRVSGRRDKFPLPLNMNAEQLLICSYDVFAPRGTGGQFAVYNVNRANGRLSLAEHPAFWYDDELPLPPNHYLIDMKWTGFGKVIGLDYKNVP